MVNCGGSGQWWANDQLWGFWVVVGQWSIVGVLGSGGSMVNCGGSGQWWANDQVLGFWAVVGQ